ncbi:MAG TPA: PA2779 family protein [Geminicoccaceae bacterium]|nr:PA2779 family protein [Geminicoccaceae bacterium]
MRVSSAWFKAVALSIAAAMVMSCLPLGAARAGLVTTEQLLDQTAAAGERERLAAVLQRDDVRRQMEALGVDRDEAVARLASLSDAEVREIAGRIDQLPAGQSFLAGVLIVAGAVLIALVILDLVGVTDVFAFINPVT